MVNETGEPAQAPDYQAKSGSVYLAKNAESQQGYRFQIGLDWTEAGCVVTVEMLQGSVGQEQEGMTLAEAVEYFKSLSPKLLGLEGASMKEYSVYPIEGTILVDGRPCLRIQAYQHTTEGTNQLAGIYLISGDRLHLYRLDQPEGRVQELPLQGTGIVG